MTEDKIKLVPASANESVKNFIIPFAKTDLPFDVKSQAGVFYVISDSCGSLIYGL